MKKEIRKNRASFQEKILVILIILSIIGAPLFNVFTKAVLSETNIQVQELSQDIDEQRKNNESLNMKINELASLDKIRKVAELEGLSYNNDNIKIIDVN